MGLGVSFILSAWLGSSRSLLHVLDTPNERSLHERPISRTGGIAILAGVVTGWALLGSRGIWPAEAGMLWICVATALIAAVSFVDDVKSLPILLRLGMHGFASVVLVWGVHLGLGVIGTVVAWFSVIWMLNLYNFMDGMDGFSAGMTLSGFCFLGGAAWLHGDEVYARYAWVIAASGLGFLFLNFPPAKIFMGDVGSTVLGMFTAAFSLWGIRDGIFPFWFPLLVFSPFVVDASVTLARRILCGEKFWQAHRSHYYQRLVQLGWGHRKTVLAEYGVMLLSGLSAFIVLIMHRSMLVWLLLAGWFVCFFAIALQIKRMEKGRN